VCLLFPVRSAPFVFLFNRERILSFFFGCRSAGEGRQQALFSKYAEERALASAEIVAALTTLKEELGLSEGGP